MARFGPVLLMCSLASSCGDHIDRDCDVFVDTTPPDTPRITAPRDDRFGIPVDSLVLRSSEFSDPDGDAHDATEFEIFLPGGTDPVRIWSATRDGDDDLDEARLSDGTFEPGRGDHLAEGARYEARVRHRDATGSCDAWSDWSEPHPFRTDDGGAVLFDPDRVHTFEIEIPPESWALIQAEACAADCSVQQRNLYTGTLRFEGQTFEGVGVSLKGGCGSCRTLDGKAAFRVNLEWDDPAVPGCPSDRRLLGVRRLTFNNAVQDWTQEHEDLAYRLYRAAGVPAPRVGHAVLRINGEPYGLYVLVEAIDRRFLSHWFDDEGGMLYEGMYWCDLLEGNVPADVSGTSCFTREFEPGPCDDVDTDEEAMDWEALRSLTQRIASLPSGGFYPEVESFFDFDAFLSLWAVEAVIAHWDSYSFHIINNYRVYHEPTLDRWTVIPWGTDQTFEGDLDPRSSDAVLVRRCLEEPDCAAAFDERLAQVDALFEEMDLGKVARELHDVLEPHVRADLRREHSDAQYDTAYQGLRDWIAARPARF